MRRYWCRFWIGAWVELPAYAYKKQRYGLAAGVLSTEVAYWAVISLCWRVNPVATLWCWGVPFMVSTFLLMFGNWCGPDAVKQCGNMYCITWCLGPG